jgi:hypothetical protein
MTKEQEREKRIQKRMNECQNFTGIQHECCKAGINYRQLVGGEDFGWARRTPCFSDRFSPVLCVKRVLHTREEAEVIENEIEESTQKFLTAVSAVHEDAKAKGLGRGKGGQSEMDCPICRGKLRYSVASVNGHIHACCATDGCVRWME